MSTSEDRLRNRLALPFEEQRLAFDFLLDHGFPMDRAKSLCRNPLNYGNWPNFADLKQALVKAGLWEPLYMVYKRPAAVS